jgi:hypothetical protein
VNCTGLGAGALCGDDAEMQSGRGGTVHYPRAKQAGKYPGDTAAKAAWAWNTVVFAEVIDHLFFFVCLP